MKQQRRRRAKDSTRRAGQIHITSVILIKSLQFYHQFYHRLASSLPSQASIYVTDCKDGKIRIMWKHQWTQGSVLGHSNAVTSLSWIFFYYRRRKCQAMASYLDILGNNLGYIFSKITIGQLALGLSRHDNTVSAAGLPVESDSIRKVATASAWIILDAINQCYFQFVSLEVVQPKL